MYEIIQQTSGRLDYTLEEWCSTQIQRFLPHTQDVKQLTRYILDMSEENMEAYLKEFLGQEKPILFFIAELKGRRRKMEKKAIPLRSALPPDLEKEGLIAYRKTKFEDDEERLIMGKGKGKGKEKEKENIQQPPQTQPQKQMKKKKQKAQTTQNLNKQNEIYLPGRVFCDCQATRHPLVGNCLSCGKIICGQEGSGPCLFCGNFVKGNKETIQDLSLYQQQDLASALSQKDRLLEYDRTSAKRTAVLDDQADYFSADFNEWYTDEEREAIKKKKEAYLKAKEDSRNKCIVTFDFAGRRVITTNPEDLPSIESSLSDSSSASISTSSSAPSSTSSPSSSSTGVYANPFVEKLPVFSIKKPTNKPQKSGSGPRKQNKNFNHKKFDRVQHDYFEEEQRQASSIVLTT